MNIQKGLSVHRLLCDLKEVLTNPIPNVAALPLEDDLYVWHGNVRSEEGSLAGAPIHFILKFPESYPNDPPEIRLLQAVPHPNVKPVPGIQLLHVNQQQAGSSSSSSGRRSHPFLRQARWRLAMWDCIPGKNSYSSSYTVLSVLLQLQVFLLDEELQYDTTTTSPEAARRTAQDITCPQCPHSSPLIHPPFPTPADLDAALKARSKLRVERPFVPARSRGTSAALQAHQVVKPVPAGKGATAAAAASSSSSGKPAATTPTTTQQQQQKVVREEEWVCVTGKKGSSKKGTATATASSSSAAAAGGDSVISQGRFGTLRTSAAHKVVKGGLVLTKGSGATSLTKQPVAVAAAASASIGTAAGGGDGGACALDPSKLSKSALKRYKKKQQQQDMDATASTSSSSSSSSMQSVAIGPITPPPTPSARPPTGSSPSPSLSSLNSYQQQREEEEEEWQVAGKGGKAAGGQQGLEGAAVQKKKKVDPLLEMLKSLATADHTEIIQQTLADAAAANKNSSSRGATSTTTSSSSSSSLAWGLEALQQLSLPCGLFSSLPRDALLAILTLLKPKDLAVLSQCCQGLNAWCNDGALWQELVQCHFPRHRVKASQMCDWKTAYVMESNSLLEGLRCWHTRVGFEEDVLGLPVTFTKNPKTGAVDYILAHPDLISMTAFKAGVRQTPERESFEAVLPLYLTADHFNRSLPHLAPLLKQLAPEHIGPGGSLPSPECWLDVLGKVLNTQVVLLADNGLAASQRALQVYCQVHRLLLAVCEHWGLWGAVSARLDRFLSREKEREKSSTPNLGLLVPLLSLSPRHKWSQVVQPLIAESMDRGVMWMCKRDIGLVESFKSALGPAADPALLSGSFETSSVSTRLMMYHVGFLHLVGSPPGSTLERVMDNYDGLYGCPGAALGGRFQKYVKDIMEVNSWREYFSRIGLVYKDDATMTNHLKSAWRRSLQKKYHTKDMDFTKIHASGVSRILLKGQGYSCPPNTKEIELEVHYKWKPEFDVRYLDGACLLFGPNREYKEMVAWNHRSSYTTAQHGAVTHSGDIMEFENQAGKNTAKLLLGQVGPQIQEVVVTLSAWADAMLSDIIQPYVQLYESKSGMELCQCHLDSTSIVTRRENKCIIMARIYRKADGSGWGVQSVMEMCQGTTSDTGPMVEAVQQVLERA